MPGPGITPLAETLRRKFRIKNEYVREAFAEFFGTIILCIFAVSAAMQFFIQIHEKQNPTSIGPVIGGILGIMTAVLVTGGASGAHINPAVTLGLAIVGETSWYKVPLYWVCQLLGAYVGAGLSCLLYYHKITQGGATSFAKGLVPVGVFSAVGGVPFGTIFLDQVFCTTVLMVGILGIIDKRNMEVPKHMIAFLICMLVLGINMCFGIQGGASMNPARSLGPSLMAVTVGFDASVALKNGDDPWWVAMTFAPFIGAALGAVLYMLLVGSHLEDPAEQKSHGHDIRRFSEKEDWRSTQFLPKAHLQQSQLLQNPNSPIPPPQPIQAFNNNAYVAGPGPQAGYNNNNSYARDDTRFRQGY